jgi:hypothetical protein
MNAYLALEDGTIFRGESVGADGVAYGEAVFTTAMTGYQETVTDPSFAEQIVCFTAPMVGNYGVAEARAESDLPHAKAVLMREARGPAGRGGWPSGASSASAASTRARSCYGSATREPCAPRPSRGRFRRRTRSRPSGRRRR